MVVSSTSNTHGKIKVSFIILILLKIRNSSKPKTTASPRLYLDVKIHITKAPVTNYLQLKNHAEALAE